MPQTILFNQKEIVTTPQFDRSILEQISLYPGVFNDHTQIAAYLQDKHSYIVTIILDSLKPEYRNRKTYVKKTKYPLSSKYQELIYAYFFEEYGQDHGDALYKQWIDKYMPTYQKEKRFESVDGYIIKQELEPKYRDKILVRFKNYEKLFAKRTRTVRERYYNLPKPLDYVDWCSPFDNLFIWKDGNKKIAMRGGSGSSGARENNSKFIYALLQLNQCQKIPSHLLLYNDENKLEYITKFSSLCVPEYDLGSNYHIFMKEDKKLRQDAKFLYWEGFDKVREIMVK